MDYSALAQALNLDAQKEAAQNPWMIGQQTINSIPTWNSQASAGRNIGAMGLQGFLSGLTGGIGKRDADSGIAARNEALRGFMTAPAEQQGAMLQENQYLKPYSSVLQAMQADEERQVAAQAAKEDRATAADLSKAAIIEQIKNPAAGEFDIKKNADGTWSVKRKEGEPIAKPLNQKGIAARTTELFKQFRQEGFPETQAATAASQALEVDRKKMGRTYKAIEASRERASQLESMAQTAEQGLSGAGRTGAWSSDLGASVLGLVSSDQAEKAAATTLLNSIKPAALSANKVPGMGAMSDFESKAFFAAAPGSDKTPEQNMALITKMKQAAQMDSEHADFLETYIAEVGDDKGAQAAWTKYKKANPLIVRDPVTKEWVANENRRPWSDMFGGAESPTVDRAVAQSQGEIVTLPNGQKVRVVD